MAMCMTGWPLVSALMTEGKSASVGSSLRMASTFWITSASAVFKSVPK